QRDRTVGFSLFGQVIKNDEDVLATVHPVLTNGRPGVWCKVFETCRIRGRSGHDGGVFQGTFALEAAADRGDGRCFLANGNVDTTYLLVRIPRFPVGFLVQNGVDTDSGLTGLAVTDDQLALATTDRNHRVDGLHAGLEWFVNRLPLGHAWCLEFKFTACFGLNWPQVVNWLTNWVYYTTHVCVTDRYGQYVAGAVHFHAFANALEVTQDNDTDFTGVEVLCKSGNAIVETQQFVCHHGRKTFDAGNSVGCVRDVTNLDTFGVGRFVRLRKLV